MSRVARVAVVFTGGTISMLVDPQAGGAVPALDGAAILARTPGLAQIAEVVPLDRGMIPASHWTFERLLGLVGDLRRLAADPDIDGVVVVQGTDTIEESSFAFDLLVDSAKPIVVTGAMRNATDPGYDGPDNLRDAVRCAATGSLAGHGVVVVLAGTIEPAADVTKTHTSRLDTFQSLNSGRLGRLEAGQIVIDGPPRLRRAILDTTVAAQPVPIVVATIGQDEGLIRSACAARPGRDRGRGDRAPATPRRASWPRPRRRWTRGSRSSWPAAARRAGRARAMPSRVAARPGSGPAPSWPAP